MAAIGLSPIAAVAAVVAPPALAASAAAPAKTTAKRSLSEFGVLIGTWTCRVSEAGKPATQSTVDCSWMYGGTVLMETVASVGCSGQFMTTLDPRSGTVKGVGVGNDGSYIVWENPGMHAGRSSEVGYVFARGALVPASRSEFEKLGGDHYVIRDFRADTASGKGAPTDTEDCARAAQSAG